MNRLRGKSRKHITVDGPKYFTESEIKLIMRTARNKSELHLAKGLKTGVRVWMLIDLLTCTGLRVSEAANLTCGDLRIGHGQAEIWVSNGKGNISGTVIIPLALKKHLRAFLQWKQKQGEGTEDADPLFVGQRGHMTDQAVRHIVKKHLKALGLYETGKAVHALRHGYAMALYRREKDLRAVQKQLRHVSIQSTLVYADVSKDEIAAQVKGLWN